MIFIYNLLIFICLVPALLVVFLRHKNSFLKEIFFRWPERFGRFDGITSDKRPLLWFHCASIGEVRAVEPLLCELAAYRLLMTVHTLAGRRYAEEKRLADNIFFAPLDFTFFIQRALKSFSPAALVLVETEFWPGMVLTAKKAGCKVLVVNGRLSAHSFKYYYATKVFWKKVLSNIDCIAARSEEDADRFKLLGYPAERITITGNLKYDRAQTVHAITRNDIGFGADDILIAAGSTRPGEEEIIVSSLCFLRKKYPRVKLIVAPRHLNMIGAIASLLEKNGISFSLYSKKNDYAGECVILDRFGVLAEFYSLCDMAFVGGSLVDKGGQNPIEPAAYSKPIIFGPYMQNFLSEASNLVSCGGAIRVNSAGELTEAFERLVSDPGLRDKMGGNAFSVVNTQKGALKRTTALIKTLIH